LTRLLITGKGTSKALLKVMANRRTIAVLTVTAHQKGPYGWPVSQGRHLMKVLYYENTKVRNKEVPRTLLLKYKLWARLAWASPN
jgi:hypothetical protein